MYNFVIYDDNPLSIQSTTNILENYYQQKKIAIQITAFMEEDELFQYLSKEPVSLLFMDIELKDGKSGIQTARLVNEWHPDCLIAYLTNYLTYATDIYETHFYNNQILCAEGQETRWMDIFYSLFSLMETESGQKKGSIFTLELGNALGRQWVKVEYQQKKGKSGRQRMQKKARNQMKRILKKYHGSFQREVQANRIRLIITV